MISSRKCKNYEKCHQMAERYWTLCLSCIKETYPLNLKKIRWYHIHYWHIVESQAYIRRHPNYIEMECRCSARVNRKMDSCNISYKPR